MSAARVAVIGAGWAGLAAAVEATARGHPVALYDTAHRVGGRARSHAGDQLDNGQHILIGAYRQTLGLMRRVGADPARLLWRRPLLLAMADGRRLQLPRGPAAAAFAWAVARCHAWRPTERAALLMQGGRWMAAGFRCEPDVSVAALCHGLPAAVRALLIDPLCVAALNTPAPQASAAVFLRVLRDGLLGEPGSSDLLLPRRPLDELLPAPALRWLRAQGAEIRLGRRVHELAAAHGGWRVDGEPFDHVVLACGAAASAELTRHVAPSWSRVAEALRYEPIVTVYVQHSGLALPSPMLGLVEDAQAPAQFVFDRGQLDDRPGLFAFVVSGAAPWTARGRDACAQAVLAQAQSQLAHLGWSQDRAHVVATLAERRATFLCTPGLQRPAAVVAPGLLAAGDHVAGPYPATLEGAVRSGLAAARMACVPAGPKGPADSTMQNTVSHL